MAVFTVTKSIGTTGVFSTPQLWEDGAPANLSTAEKSAAGTFLTAAFIQGESLSFVGSGATGKLIDTDSTGAGTGTYVSYGLITGNPAAGDVVTGATSTATCVLSSSTPTAAGCIWEGQLQNQEFSGTGIQVTMGGSTTSATAYKHLTTVAGASFRNHASVQSNALKYNATLGAAVRGTSTSTETIVSAGDDVRLTGLQVAATGTGGRAMEANGNGNDVLDFCIFEGTYVATSSIIGVIAVRLATQVRNCLIVQLATAADHIVATGTSSSSFFNCTIVAPDDLATNAASIFLSGASGTITVQNCAMFAGGDSPTAAGSATFGFTTCYGDDSTPASGITAATYSSQFENVNNATRDFRVKTGAGLIDTGTTDTTNAPIDIAGTARPSGSAYDVGCWELVAAAGGSIIPVLMRQYRERRA